MAVILIKILSLIDNLDGTYEIAWERAGVTYQRRITADRTTTPKKLAQWIIDQPIEGRAVKAERYGAYTVTTDANGQVIDVQFVQGLQ